MTCHWPHHHSGKTSIHVHTMMWSSPEKPDLLSVPVLPVLFPSHIVHMLRVSVKAGVWSLIILRTALWTWLWEVSTLTSKQLCLCSFTMLLLDSLKTLFCSLDLQLDFTPLAVGKHGRKWRSQWSDAYIIALMAIIGGGSDTWSSTSPLVATIKVD